MDVKLVIQKGTKRMRVVQLRNEETLVGRRQDCDLRIQSSEVSRRHCLLKIQGQALIVEDLDSINGTFVNGRRIKGKQVVRPGDLLGIGPVNFRVDYEGEAEPAEVLPVDDEATAAVDALDVLPLVGDPTQTEPVPVVEELEDANPSASLLEALEVADELDKDGHWHLPEADELRDLLSEMDIEDPESKAKSESDSPGEDSYRVK